MNKETLIARRRQLCQDMGSMAWPDEARAALEEIKYGRIERNGNCEAAISSKTKTRS